MQTRTLRLGDKEILVVDGLVDEQRVGEIDSFCRQLAFQRIRYSYRDSAEAPMQYGHQWLHLVTQEETARLPIRELRAFVDERFADRGLSPSRAHLSCIQPGDSRFAHIDDATGRVLTAVYFVNQTWARDWAGELVFFNGDEASLAVFPRPGRVVLFDGTTLHRGGVPSLSAGDVRFALAHKFMAKG
ncbi:2OG-Fe(II) oxygenase [Hyalangium versicolor]|uniref:2OG-Fe(II) oxygenase n=1 Tax=Hyalangium versicolor TaxID=2861190 RepID=UPI001CCAB0B9|nr:2OG-Fe(II) oxygenase [Hyalangium versicolor]